MPGFNSYYKKKEGRKGRDRGEEGRGGQWRGEVRTGEERRQRRGEENS